MPRPKTMPETVQNAPVVNDTDAASNVSNEIDKDAEISALKAELDALKSQMAAPNVVLAKPEEMVKLACIDTISSRNVLTLGDFGTLNSTGGCIEISRKDFGGRFMTESVQKLLQKRRLIVLDGLSEDERHRYGVDYQKGETLDMQMLDRLLDIDIKALKKIFSALCPEHKKLVATRFYTLLEKGDNRVSRERVELLNEVSKQSGQALFTPILQKLNADCI